MRLIPILSLVAAVGVAAGVFQLKMRAEALAEHLSDLDRSISREEETIALLKAEWSLLGQPARIQEIVLRHKERFGLAPPEPMQWTPLATVPDRQPDAIEAAILDAEQPR